MPYIDGFVLAVPTANKEAYIRHAREMAPIFKEYGCLGVVECWGDDVPDGKLTSFPMAVKREPHETVVFAWMSWPDRAARDAAWALLDKDPRTRQAFQRMPFDGKRMIYGGFEMIVDM